MDETFKFYSILILYSMFPELLIPPNANVYYAINTQYDLNFVLKKKKTKEEEKEEALFKNSTPSRRARDTSKARRKLLGLAL